jgi:hypothetical protein
MKIRCYFEIRNEELFMKTIILSLIASLSAICCACGECVYSTMTPTVDNGGSDGAGVVLVLLAIGTML